MVDFLAHFELTRDTTKAIELFQMSADLYPNSAKAWDGLGEGWQAKGDAKKATGFYEKSLSMNPNNQHAKDMIKKIAEGKK
jgi:hypothetical protein